MKAGPPRCNFEIRGPGRQLSMAEVLLNFVRQPTGHRAGCIVYVTLLRFSGSRFVLRRGERRTRRSMRAFEDATSECAREIRLDTVERVAPAVT